MLVRFKLLIYFFEVIIIKIHITLNFLFLQFTDHTQQFMYTPPTGDSWNYICGLVLLWRHCEHAHMAKWLYAPLRAACQWEGDWSVFSWIENNLTIVAMWRKLFASVPAFRAPKAPCRSFKSSSRRAEKDFFKGEMIHLIYFMNLYQYGRR